MPRAPAPLARMTPAEQQRKDFLKLFNSLGSHHSRYQRFADFLELATCTIRRQCTLPPGPEADAMEARYMQIVQKYPPAEINNIMPKLMGHALLAMADGGHDFLGTIVQELELLDTHLGQFITPYDIARLMAKLSLEDAAHIIAERGWLSACEPASGAGGMLIATADVLQEHGFDPAATLYAEATDIAAICFHMTYLQLAARGIPATVIRANTLTREFFEAARTPAFFPFVEKHRDSFLQWQAEARQAQPLTAPAPPLPRPQAAKRGPVPNHTQGDLFADPNQPDPATTTPRRHKRADPAP